MGLIQSDGSICDLQNDKAHWRTHGEKGWEDWNAGEKKGFKTEILISQSTYTNLSRESQVLCLELFSKFT